MTAPTLLLLRGAGHPLLGLSYTTGSYAGSIGNVSPVTILAAPAAGLRHAIGFLHVTTSGNTSDWLRLYWEDTDTGIGTTTKELLSCTGHREAPVMLPFRRKNPITSPVTGVGNSQFILKGITANGSDTYYITYRYLLLEA